MGAGSWKARVDEEVLVRGILVGRRQGIVKQSSLLLGGGERNTRKSYRPPRI